jgi:16S rRNA (guanine1207-N2)-methyltransferase
MSPRTSDPDAVEATMAELVLDALARPAARVLVAGEADDRLAKGLAERGAQVATWHRFAAPGRRAAPWPAAAPADQAVIRLPRIRASFELALHAVTARLSPGADVWVVGTNDEGIRSAGGKMEPLFDEVVTIDARRHGRVLRGRLRPELPGLRAALADWRTTGAIRLAGGERPWVAYPGLFARGELDPATALLVETIPPLADGARVLDFGCGAGAIGAALLARGDGIELDQLDADAIAVVAARENLPGARTWLGSSLADLTGAGSFDAVVTNPPIHESVVRSYRAVEQLAGDVGARLRPGGRVWLVAQRQVPIEQIFTRAGLASSLAAQRGAFRVWSLSP